MIGHKIGDPIILIRFLSQGSSGIGVRFSSHQGTRITDGITYSSESSDERSLTT